MRVSTHHMSKHTTSAVQQGKAPGNCLVLQLGSFPLLWEISVKSSDIYHFRAERGEQRFRRCIPPLAARQQYNQSNRRAFLAFPRCNKTIKNKIIQVQASSQPSSNGSVSAAGAVGPHPLSARPASTALSLSLFSFSVRCSASPPPRLATRSNDLLGGGRETWKRL
jgi:hypothetical protein